MAPNKSMQLTARGAIEGLRMSQGCALACVLRRLAPSSYASPNSHGLAAADRRVR